MSADSHEYSFLRLHCCTIDFFLTLTVQSFINSKHFILLGDGLMARRRTLTPLIGVRIPVPQPVLNWPHKFFFIQCLTPDLPKDSLPINQYKLKSPISQSRHNVYERYRLNGNFHLSILNITACVIDTGQY